MISTAQLHKHLNTNNNNNNNNNQGKLLPFKALPLVAGVVCMLLLISSRGGDPQLTDGLWLAFGLGMLCMFFQLRFLEIQG